MNRVEVEGLVHRVIADLEAGRPVEDDRIEVKREWPTDFDKTARRVAGHANSAGQEPIIWIIGVDESTRTLVGASADQDPANWSQNLQAAFADNWAPVMASYNIPRDGKIVVAFVFSTEGAPYLVRVKGTDSFEVPWRASTRIRSARRHEIFSILSVPLQFPDFEILHGELTAQANRRSPPGDIYAHTFAVSVTLYVTPRSERHVFFPLHRTRFVVKFEGLDDEIVIGPAHAQAVEEDPNVQAERRQVGFKAPGFVRLFTSEELSILSIPDGTPLVRLLLAPAGSARGGIELRASFAPDRSIRGDYRKWTFGGG